MTIDQLICQLEYAATIVGRDADVRVDATLERRLALERVTNHAGYALLVTVPWALTPDHEWHPVAYSGGLDS